MARQITYKFNILKFSLYFPVPAAVAAVQSWERKRLTFLKEGEEAIPSSNEHLYKPTDGWGCSLHLLSSVPLRESPQERRGMAILHLHLLPHRCTCSIYPGGEDTRRMKWVEEWVNTKNEWLQRMSNYKDFFLWIQRISESIKPLPSIFSDLLPLTSHLSRKPPSVHLSWSAPLCSGEWTSSSPTLGEVYRTVKGQQRSMSYIYIIYKA